MSAICPHDDPDPDPYFDPVAFFADDGDMGKVAAHLHAGDAYRKALLGLDALSEVKLRRELARHRLVMVDAGTEWVFLAAVPTDDEGAPPAEPKVDPCSECGQPAVEGNITCGRWRCVAALGRRELAARRGGKGK